MKYSLLLASMLSFVLTATATLANDNAPVTGVPVVESRASMVKSSIDPWEKFNRSMFSFNQGADKHVLKPLAKTYVRITPAFFRRGVDNVLSNVMEIPSVLNSLLQGNLGGAAHYTGRLIVNSTLGLAGILDVAQHMNLKHTDHEDFGQTLAVWGVASGPYIVLPLLGPSSLRDTSGLPVDWYTDPKTYIDHVRTKNSIRITSILNARANLMPLEKSVTGDKYVFYREAYLQRRNFLIKNGEVEDSFGEEDSAEQDSGF